MTSRQLFALLLASTLAPLAHANGVDDAFNNANNLNDKKVYQSETDRAAAQAALDRKQLGQVAAQVAALMGTSVAQLASISSGEVFSALTIKMKTKQGSLCEVRVLDIDISDAKYLPVTTPPRLPAMRALCGDTKEMRAVGNGSAFWGASILESNVDALQRVCNLSGWSVDVTCYDSKGNDADGLGRTEALRNEKGVKTYLVD
jgi:hypothetical protein